MTREFELTSIRNSWHSGAERIYLGGPGDIFSYSLVTRHETSGTVSSLLLPFPSTPVAVSFFLLLILLHHLSLLLLLFLLLLTFLLPMTKNSARLPTWSFGKKRHSPGTRVASPSSSPSLTTSPRP